MIFFFFYLFFVFRFLARILTFAGFFVFGFWLPSALLGHATKPSGRAGACFRARYVVNNSLALRAIPKEDVVLMTSLILSKTQ